MHVHTAVVAVCHGSLASGALDGHALVHREAGEGVTDDLELARAQGDEEKKTCERNGIQLVP